MHFFSFFLKSYHKVWGAYYTSDRLFQVSVTVIFWPRALSSHEPWNYSHAEIR